MKNIAPDTCKKRIKSAKKELKPRYDHIDFNRSD